MMGEAPEDVIGAEQLVRMFGCWPSFHGAEVLRFCLDRAGCGDTHGPTAECVIHVYKTTGETSPIGRLIRTNHSLVTLRFLEVDTLELSDFNHQNVLGELSIINIAARQMERVKFAVNFDNSWGIESTFQCFGVEVVSVEPCNSEGNVV